MSPLSDSFIRARSSRATLLLLLSAACHCGRKEEQVSAPVVAPIPKSYVPNARCPIARPMLAAAEANTPVEGSDEDGDEDIEIALIKSAYDNAYDAQKFDEALACGQEMSRLFPDDPLGHIQRGMALDSLGQNEEAHQAFERALAMNPLNPAALLPAAQFLVDRADTDALETAIIYTRRGRENEPTAKKGAALAAVEAEALNGLGLSEEALSAAESALALDSEMPRAATERGVALFELLRFTDAEKALSEARVRDPENAKALHYSGLIAERDGRSADADRYFAEATRLDPSMYPPALDVGKEEFQKLVDEQVNGLTNAEKETLAKTKFSWSDLPEMDDLLAGEPVLSPTIVGIYRPGEPDAILLYRKNLLRVAHTMDELKKEVRDTLLHELGHANGEDDDELRDRGL